MVNIKLRGKIIGVAILAAVIPTFLLLVLVLFKQSTAEGQLSSKLEVFSQELVGTSASNVYDSCEIANEILLSQLRTDLNLAKYVVEREGGITFDGSPVQWEAIGVTGQTVPVELPALKISNTVIPPIYDFDSKVPVVDEITNNTGATATIFQRMNEDGDMLRVATTVPQAALGLRATGTFLGHREQTGELNAIIKQVLAGEDFLGLAEVVDAWYLTLYTPIRDSKDDAIVGMLYVGLNLDTLPSLEENIANTRVGKHGTVAILQGQGPLQGTVVIMKDKDMVGRNIKQIPEDHVRTVYEQVIADASKLPKGEVKSIFYDAPIREGNRKGGVERMILSYTYYAPWDWVICAKAPVSDFDQSQDQITAIFKEIVIYVVVGGLLGLAIAMLVALILAGKIADPISELTGVADFIAKGDLDGARKRALASNELRRVDLEREDAERAIAEIKERSSQHGLKATVIAGIKRVEDMDETSQLITAVRTMVLNLNTLVTKVKDSSVQLIATATQISATSRQQEANVQNFSTSSNEIAAAVKQIDATSQELLGTMDHVTGVAGEAGNMAESGRSRLGDMTSTIERLAKASSSISSKLSIINEKASNIGFVVTTISKVADQTNLLSLNAAIEAEQAGEYGSGFAVVAREIRRLADQTAESTLDIEDMVKEMQSAVSSGVMEMDKFTDEVRSGVEETENISLQFGEIIGQVQQLTPRFKSVYEGMQSQSKGATQISKAMEQLTEIASQSSDSLQEFNQASLSLREALSALRDEVSTFKTIRQDLIEADRRQFEASHPSTAANSTLKDSVSESDADGSPEEEKTPSDDAKS